uniref:Cytochrome c oxidase subunit 3 n=1 Tax=Loxechinus albus TaxID=240836 RepID=A0A139YGZ0_9ECHO|nr:cytochrome c oxidase subunit 3 [Loxechinus albus]
MAHQHPYHLVDQSPWPLTGANQWLNDDLSTSPMIPYPKNHPTQSSIISTYFNHGNMVTSHSTGSYFPSKTHCNCSNSTSIRHDFFYNFWSLLLLLLFSESFFHSSLAPSVEIGVTSGPPSGITPLNPFLVPLLNTAVLLSSGVTITWSHHSILAGNRTEAIQALFLTVALGVYFTILQAWEYIDAPFTIADSVYGSTFFVATGFHGLHVIIGTTFLLICLLRLSGHHFSTHHHFGFEAAAWYWHFVDVVWLFLYVCIYWWGS